MPPLWVRWQPRFGVVVELVVNFLVFSRAWVVACAVLMLAGCSSWLGSPTTWRNTAVGVSLPRSSADRSLTALRPELEAAQAAGAAFVRVPVRKENIESAPAQYDWSFADGLVNLAADKLKLRLMPYVADPSAAVERDAAQTTEFSDAFAERYAGRIWSWPPANVPGVPAGDAMAPPSGPRFSAITDEAPDALARALVAALDDSAVDAIAWEPRSAEAFSRGPGADAFAQVARWFARPYQALAPKFEVTRGDDAGIKVHGFRLKDGRFIVAAWLEDAARAADVRVRFSMPGVADVQLTDARGVRLPEARARWGERWFAIELNLALQGDGVVFAEASPARP